MEERELLEKIRKNPAEFSVLFKLYYQSIFGYILRRTGNIDDTADIAADSFMKAFTHIRQFTYIGISVKNWLYRIATNEVNLYFRHRRKHESVFERKDIPNLETFHQYLHDDKTELENELHRHEQFLSMLEQVKNLNLKYQEVIALRYFEGKENREIAEILDMKEGTVKSLLSRGLERLRQKCNHINYSQ